MKVAPCIQEVSGHTTSLLTSLNLQREKALFCDCVVRQTQNPGQLHPAHRCVLAASSPVLASILSSTGALVELQDPCLSGSVLAVLLDYIYTGALPCACSQRQYNSLLSAACYLQMNKLQEALCARQQAELNEPNETDTSTGTESQADKNIISTHSEAADTFNGGLLSTSSIDACRGDEHTCSVQRTASSLEGTNGGKYDGTQMHSHSIDTRPKEAKTNTCGARSMTGAKCCNRKDVSTLSESSGNAGDCSEVIHLTPRAVIQNIPSTSEGYSVSTVDKDTQKDQFHSAGTIKPETWQATTEEELVRRSSSSSASSLQHTCSGAVPVICHSSTAAMLQLAEVATATFYNPASRTSGDFSRVSTPRPASTENNTVEEIASEHKSHYGKGNLGHRDNKDNSGTQSWDSKDTLDQCDTRDSRHKSRTNQSDSLKQDYTCSSANHLIKLSDKRVDSGLSHVTDCNGYHANCMYDHNENHTKPFGEDSVPQSKVCSRFIGGLKYKTNLSFDDLPYKHQRLDWSDWDVSMSAAVKEPPQDLRTGSSSHCGDICSEGEVKEEHGCSSKYPFAMTKHFSQHDCDSDNRNTAMEDERHSVCPHVSNTPESNLDNVTSGLSVLEHHTLLDLGKISDANTSEPHFAFTVPVASDPSHSMYSAVGQSYHGHVHYHCLSKEETHLTHIDSHPDSSDHSSDDEAFGTFASPGQSPVRQHFDTGTPEQVLLLDISTKHAELLVSYKHRADQEKKALDKKDPFGTGIENNDREQRNETKSVAGTKIRARTKFRATTFSGSRNKPVEERQFVDREQSRLGPEVKNKAEAVEVSRHGEVAYQTGTLTGCSAPTVPESVQAYVSSTLSVRIPSSLPASTPTNISSHLSTPVNHAFQCSLCDRSFSQRGSLNRHVRSHLGVRPFPCPCCPMTFSRQYRVTEHMRVHQRCALGNYLAKPPASSI